MSSPECELARTASSAGSRSKAAIPPASISASSPNGLTVERSVTSRSGSPSWRRTRPLTSASTISPRWTLSSIPLRRCRARIGATIRPRAVVRVVDRPERGLVGALGAGTIDGSPGRAAVGEPLGARGYPDDCYDGWRAITIVPRRSHGRHVHPHAARLAAPGRPPQAGHPARRTDRAQEVPRGRARAVVAARLRGAGRRRRATDRHPDARSRR